MSTYVVDVIDFFREKVTPLINSLEEWKTIEAKIKNLESVFTDAVRAWNNGHGDVHLVFDALHEADTKMLMIEFAELLGRHQHENQEEWSKLLDERNGLHDKYLPLIKRLSNFLDVRQIVSPRFLLIIVLGFIEILSALAIILSIYIIPTKWTYFAYTFEFFLMFYVFTATMELLWEFLKW